MSKILVVFAAMSLLWISALANFANAQEGADTTKKSTQYKLNAPGSLQIEQKQLFGTQQESSNPDLSKRPPIPSRTSTPAPSSGG